MHYYQHNIGDYRRDTVHLSLLEHGIYRQLLDWYYLEETPIPKETEVVFRRLRVGSEDEQKAVLAVLGDFFELTENGYIQGRADAEIARFQAKGDRARENGKAGGRPRKTKVVISENQEQTQSKPTEKLTKELNNSINKNKKGFVKPGHDDLVLAFTGKVPNPEKQAQAFFNHYETVGWVVGKARTPMKNWKSAVTNWIERGKEYAKSNAISSRPDSRAFSGRGAIPGRDKADLAAEIAFGPDAGAQGFIDGDFERVDAHEAVG